jgi:hypothetical protein
VPTERKYRQIARQTGAPVELSPDELKELFSERTTRIVAFSDLNSRRRRWIALAWIVDELSTRLPDGSRTAYRDKAKEAEAIKHLLVAIGAGQFSRKNPNAAQRERLLFLSQSEPFHFISRDEAISISNMTELSYALDVLVRMWAPRATLEALFRKQDWKLPAWLTSSPAHAALSAGKTFSELDGALYPIMSDLLERGEASSVAEAARDVVGRAKSRGGTPESIAKRLERGYRAAKKSAKSPIRS